MDIVNSVNGVPIRLTDERWAHVRDNRTEVAALKEDLLITVSAPDVVVEGHKGALIALKAGIMGRTMVVVYREVSQTDGYIITAWLTSRPDRYLKRRETWRSKP